MKEDFLHYLWKHKKFDFTQIKSTDGGDIIISQIGSHNHLAGPDFFNATLVIAGQQWAGNVEIHLKSSDWYAHGHEKDRAYDNVILHVVWEHDIAIYREDNSEIPTLELKKYVSQEALANYRNLFAQQSVKWINCENDIKNVPAMVQDHWLERLYFERLSRKTASIQLLLERLQNDWEALLFVLLARSFGTKVNGASFQSLAQSIPFKVIRKCAQEPFQFEALLFGMGNLLPDDTTDSYPMQLQGEFDFLESKFGLSTTGILPVQFFKLRPDNFPTIRLSQLAQLYNAHQQLFQKVVSAQNVEELYNVFDVKASPYWDTHYSFGASQKKRVKKLTKPFIDLLLINTVIPLKFYYAQHQGKDENDLILEMIQSIKPERNTIISTYNSIRNRQATNAQETQALLELKNFYCSPNKCLQCGIGNYLLGR